MNPYQVNSVQGLFVLAETRAKVTPVSTSCKHLWPGVTPALPVCQMTSINSYYIVKRLDLQGAIFSLSLLGVTYCVMKTNSIGIIYQWVYSHGHKAEGSSLALPPVRKRDFFYSFVVRFQTFSGLK